MKKDPTTVDSDGDRAGQSYRKTLTSVTDNLHVDEWELTAGEVVAGAQGCPIRKMTLHGGRQEGVDVILVDNGELKFTICPTRGMSVLSVTMGDVFLGWSRR
jgi:hypothetical protein